MRQTHEYSSTHYTRDTGFPLVWIFTYFFKRGAKSIDKEVEASKYDQGQIGGGRKIIGRAAGQDAYVGKSAARFKEARSQIVPTELKDDS